MNEFILKCIPFVTIIILLIILILINKKENFIDKKTILKKSNNRIIIIGDIHADYEQFENILIKLKLIDDKYNWIAEPKNTKIVQVGDVLDGGGRFNIEVKGELKILDLIENININAKKYNGGIYPIIGNHELMNLQADFRYASNLDIESMGGTEIRKELFSRGGLFAKRIARSFNVILNIDGYLFCHAGLPYDDYINLNRKDIIEYLNTITKKYFNGDYLEENELNDIKKYIISYDSLLWNRYYSEPNKNTCKNLSKLLSKLNAKKMIIGHTPQENINFSCNDNLIKVDVAISRCFGNNNIEVLEINKDNIKIIKL